MSHDFYKSKWSSAVTKLNGMLEDENKLEAITENQEKIND